MYDFSNLTKVVEIKDVAKIENNEEIHSVFVYRISLVLMNK